MTANLLSRLQGLTAPDREVDALIHTATNAPLREGLRFGRVPAYTASLDAAVALCERVLPGWSWECRASGTGDKGQATVWNPSKAPGYNEEQRAYNCATPAIALLIAILTALEARDGTE